MIIVDNNHHTTKTIAIDENTTIDFIEVKGGIFEMGGESWNNDSSKPIHQVELDTFWIAKYPVTQAQWQAVILQADKKNIKHSLNPKCSRFEGENRPVERVSWHDCQSFLGLCNQILLSSQFSLPTEAQWEYAARGGIHWKDNHQWAGTNIESHLKNYAWYDESAFGQTMPVGLKMPNQLGIYDMTGNVWEWCEDKYDSNYYTLCDEQNQKNREIVKNPVNKDSNTTHFVNRGGSYFYDAVACAVRYRYYYDAVNRHDNIGFRCVVVFQL
ncbi:MAG: formylglycine-generating enzyme family protein [Bacteroidetes bacterium]|nr:MAG: formylglycine-generating enzyme family protein [Bacteroidota bacterium]TAG91528.1 MAG: formylglycine-generating enzyme family protein [Bacteroidota bacterium]